jgi:hypothetical protein
MRSSLWLQVWPLAAAVAGLLAMAAGLLALGRGPWLVAGNAVIASSWTFGKAAAVVGCLPIAAVAVWLPLL